MSNHRRPDEVVVVVRRPGADGRAEYLVVLRSPERLGYWHLISGGVEWGEAPEVAAARELREETGLVASPTSLGDELAYSLAGDPEAVRARFAPGTETVVVHPFVVDAGPGWEPILDDEHVDHVWLGSAEAVARLHYPEPQEAVRRAAR